LGIGARPEERPEQRVRREAVVLTSASVAVLAVVWTTTYLILDRPLAAAIPFVYQVVSVAGLIYLARTHDFGTFRVTQGLAILILPFLLQWSLGGFVSSGAVMVWAFVAPAGALVVYRPREAVPWFVAFVVLTIVSGLINPLLVANIAPLPTEVSLLFFVLDLTGVAFVVYLVLQYVVAERDRAQSETDRLLHNILPITIADRLRAGEQRIADDYPSVTVLFADVAGFTPLAHELTADEVVAVLDRAFTLFDGLADEHGLEKIKTIGDAYMAVAGAPVPRDDHVRAAADMALGMLDAVQVCSREVNRALQVRIGLHTGSAMAGVIGQRKFIYDLWGDAVNIASRMETLGVPGSIHVTEQVRAALGDEYLFEDRGVLDVKGLGEMHTYFLTGRKSNA
jgi:guanylate cyclase